MKSYGASMYRVVAVLGLALATSAAADEPEWQVVSRGPVVIRQRTLPNSNVTEVQAEAIVRASMGEVEAVILDYASYPDFMPHVRESSLVRAPGPDGRRTTYTRVGMPLISDRDYVIEIAVRSGPSRFVHAWTSVPDALPEVPGVVRLRVNHGSWRGSAAGKGETRLVYTLTAEPGAGVPPALVRMTNKSAVTGLFEAIEREAIRRMNARGNAAKAMSEG